MVMAANRNVLVLGATGGIGSISTIGGLNARFGARARALAQRATLIIISTEGALFPTAIIVLVAIATELLKAWSRATLASLPVAI
jgi:hypothetical protein